MQHLLKVKLNLKIGPNTKAIMNETIAMLKIMGSLRADRVVAGQAGHEEREAEVGFARQAR